MKAARFAATPPAVIAAAKRLYESGAAVADIAAKMKIAASTVARYAAREGWTRPADGTPPPRQAEPAAPGKTAAKKTAAKTASAKTVAAKKGATKPGKPEESSRRKATMTKKRLPRSENSATPSPDDSARQAAGAHESPPDASPAQRRAALVARLWDAAERQIADVERRLGDAAGDSAGRERDARALAVLVRVLKELSGFDAPDGDGPAATESCDDDIERAVDECRAQLARLVAGLREGGSGPGADSGGDSAAPGAGSGGELVASGA
jgi:hypothetical protein